MRFDYFSIIGYLSVLLWIAVPVLWFKHSRTRPKKWLCHIALAVALMALLFAKINSHFYVNRIQLDMSEQMAEWEAEQEAKRKDLEASRSEDVANIRFAEDDNTDYLDKAGMEDSDLKYMNKINEDVPAWKKEKKTRAESRAADDSVEAQIGATDDSEGVESGDIDEVAESDPVLMIESDKALANRLDGLNLKLTRLLVILALIIVIADYLRRANIYGEAYVPLPVPSKWLAGVTPVLPLMLRPEPGRRTIPEELAWLTARGDCFVYMTNDPEKASKVPSKLPRVLGHFFPVDVIRVTDDQEAVSDEFVFETLWYGRSSFVVESGARSEQMLGSFMSLLLERKATRASVRQTAHIIWDIDTPLSEEWQHEFSRLTKATGMSLLLYKY